MDSHDRRRRRSRRPPARQRSVTSPRASHSRFVQRVRRRYEGELPLLPAGLPIARSIDALVERLLAEGGRRSPRALRVARQLVHRAPGVLDVERSAPLARHHAGDDRARRGDAEPRARSARCAEQDARHGVPRNAAGERIDFWIVGMGKLGARELNVSSDIDLVYVYEEDGATDGAAADQRARVLLAARARPLRADRRRHRGRLRVPRRPGAAPERQLGAAGGQPGDARGIPAGAGPRMGALRLAEEPRRRAARAASPSGRALALRVAGHRLRLPPLPRLRRVRGAAPAARARCATRRSGAPPAGPSAPTTSSCRAAASARSSSSCSCCWSCAAASSPRCAPARR